MKTKAFLSHFKFLKVDFFFKNIEVEWIFFLKIAQKF